MILPIYIYGHPVLHTTAEDIPVDYPNLQQLIADMWDTLIQSKGVGLAAPQIGKSIRVIVVNLDILSNNMPEYKDFRHVYINPHIIEYDNTKTSLIEEGCLSLPTIYEKILRPTRIRVQWLDDNLNSHEEWIEGYLARVLQHEIDHLNGKLFIDRIYE